MAEATIDQAVYLAEQDVGPILKDMAIQIEAQIRRENIPSSDVYIVGVKNGGVDVAEKIAQYLKELSGYDFELGSIDCSLDRDNSGPVKGGSDLNTNVGEKYMILVDEVISTGRTAAAALRFMSQYGRPKAIRLAVLVDRKNSELPIKPDFVGTNVFDLGESVIKYRNGQLILTNL